MGKKVNLSSAELNALTCCALLHDNALTEYIIAERLGKIHDPARKAHCEFGQRNVDTLQFGTDVSRVILYHHERADGSGPFGKKDGEIPLMAEIIGICDSLDVSTHLQRVEAEALPVVREDIRSKIGTMYTAGTAEILLSVLNEGMLSSLRDYHIAYTADGILPTWEVDMEDQSLFNLAEFISRIIDYKSAFTQRHTSGIASKALCMADYYGFDRETRTEFYLAASFHDIGKLATPSAVLEKQGELTDEEFQIIKKHVFHTWELLKDIKGFERVCEWASNHHEKLDGTGYPFGKKAEALDFNSRLLVCIDIYQAVSEERPYHPGRSHEDTMKILNGMAEKGFIDSRITGDLDKVLAGKVSV
jgi:HD-GYP domain-containing protein (c-di-GMP phosphodiesterase class II)